MSRRRGPPHRWRRAPRGERVWDVRRPGDDSVVQVKSVWHLPHRRRQKLGDIAECFAGDIWVVEFARDLSVQCVRMLPGAAFADVGCVFATPRRVSQ